MIKNIAISAMVSLVMVLGVSVLKTHLYPTPSFGSVRLDDLLNNQLEAIKTLELEEKELTRISQNFAKALDRSISDISINNNLLLIVDKAGISGFDDYTDLIELDIKKRMEVMD